MAIEVISTPTNQANGNQNLELLGAQGFEIINSLGNNSSIELNLLSVPDNIVLDTTYNYKGYKIIQDQPQQGSTSNSSQTQQIDKISIDPTKDIQSNFPNELVNPSAQYRLIYNFYDNIIGNYLQTLFIKEISSDRTEIRLDSFKLDASELESQTLSFVSERFDSNYFVEFHLNVGNNIFIPCINIKIDNEDPLDPTVLVKLKDSLPNNYRVNDTLYVVKILDTPLEYLLSITPDPIEIKDTTPIQGPNFNIDLKSQVNNSTLPLSYNDLLGLGSGSMVNSTSSLNQINSLLNEKSININVDYTDFNNFVHFSSAQTRLENFYYKIELIEEYSSSLATLDNTSAAVNMSSSKASFEGRISNIINNFDGYERFLYYDSGSSSYPKTNSQIPYILAKSDSSSVIDWLGNGNLESPLYKGMLSSASIFDENNRNQLLKSIPEYLRDDSSNQQYELFIDMVAQYYDNIWIYLKDVTNKYNNDNRLNFGISKDLVAEAIKDFGIKLYQNNFSNNDLYTAFLGLTPEGGLFPYPNMTGSLPTPTGFEYTDILISASNDILPQDDVNKSLYKRIYHNLPFLLNSKGTIPGLRALITSYGIPDTILRINEYGGKDKVDVNDWDHWQNEFNYAFTTSGSNFISSSWELNSSWGSQDNTPETLMFRFKTDGLPTIGSDHHSQSVWFGDGNTGIILQYTGSGYTSGSYSGSIKDPYYQYAFLEFYPDLNNSSNTASVYLPFFDGDWWSVMVTRQDTGTSSSYNLYSGNKIYEGGDNNTIIGFFESSSIDGVDSPWTSTVSSYFPVSFSVQSPWGYDIVTYDDTAIYDGTSGASSSYSPISGSYQEIRYYSTRISESVFKDYVMNPYSIEGNNINSSPNELAFRAPIGGELYTGSVSIHPKVTGSWVATHSFASNSNFYYDSTPNFITNKEFFFVDQPVAGIKNVIGDKIRIEDNVFPGGYPTSSVLSPFDSVLQQTNISQSYTSNINYLEVAFSPQNQINEDIMSQLGFFNIGDYIGDPRLRSSSAESYPDLDKLRDDYFQKYIKNYDLKDFIRLIKFFDNSLFKMIKDFVPARTSLASGLVIKQHLLERNKYPQPQVTDKTTIAKYAKSGSIIYNQPIQQQNLLVSGTVLPQSKDYDSGSIVKTSGGAGGSLNQFNGLNTSPYGVLGTGPNNKYFLTQSWSQSIDYISGSINSIISNQDEFYNGEFSGSNITATTQSLAPAYPSTYTLLNYSTRVYKNDFYGESFVSDFTEGQFLDPSTTPCEGEILFLAPYLKAEFILGQGIVFQVTDPYIKIHKDDCSGINSRVPLNQASIIKVQNVGDSSYTSYNITNKTENQSSFLFKLKKGDINTSGSGIYSTVENYLVSALTNPFTLDDESADPTIVTNYSTVTSGSSNSCAYSYDSGYITFDHTPNITLEFTSSFQVSCSNITTGTTELVRLRRIRNSITTTVANSSYNTGQPSNVVTSSFNTALYPLKGDQYYLDIGVNNDAGQTSAFSKFDFAITQSVPDSASQCVPIFMEPYITLNNYYNSDFNPTMNSIMDNRKNTIYQDIDYSQGINTPVNFGFLISGSAEKFPIPDSHYTQKSSTIPRYEGAKSTSQQLNVWSPGDTGTYGEVPPVDLLKTKIVYADWIGGYPPEHMNASGVHVQYLIDENGSIKIPNTSENSLEDVQQTFESRNKLIINSTTIGTGEATPKRNIIRGGSRIEPILYTQYGHSPALWNVTASFVGDFVSDLTTVDSYEITAKPSVGLPTIPLNTYTKLDFNAIVFEGNGASFSNSEFIITQAMLDENVSITVNADVQAMIAEGALGAQTFVIYAKLVKERGGVISNLGGTLLNSYDFTSGQTGDNLYIPINRPQYNFNTAVFRNNGEVTFPLSTTINNQDLQAGDKIYVQGKHQVSTPNTGTTGGDVRFLQGTSKFTVNQDPIPSGNAVSSSGTNTIWGYPSTTNLTAITASSPILNQFYGRGYKMDNTKGYVTGSGFGTVSLDFDLKQGDEFRFEGNENNTFMIKRVYGPGDTDDFRISQTGSIEVQFDDSLPSSSINLDHFLIRRYVPDASQIVIQGFKPTNAVGPYIIKPEYVTPELNKGIDDYILDLTNKGLI